MSLVGLPLSAKRDRGITRIQLLGWAPFASRDRIRFLCSSGFRKTFIGTKRFWEALVWTGVPSSVVWGKPASA